MIWVMQPGDHVGYTGMRFHPLGEEKLHYTTDEIEIRAGLLTGFARLASHPDVLRRRVLDNLAPAGSAGFVAVCEEMRKVLP